MQAAQEICPHENPHPLLPSNPVLDQALHISGHKGSQLPVQVSVHAINIVIILLASSKFKMWGDSYCEYYVSASEKDSFKSTIVKDDVIDFKV